MRRSTANNTGDHADLRIGFETGYLRLIRALIDSNPPAAMPVLSRFEPHIIAQVIAAPLIRGQSITNWAMDDFEDGTVTGVSELDFTALPDISCRWLAAGVGHRLWVGEDGAGVMPAPTFLRLGRQFQRY